MTSAVPTYYLTAREAMLYLKVGSQSALYRLIRQHRMPFCRVGRLYRFDVRELDAWMRGPNAASGLAVVRRTA